MAQMIGKIAGFYWSYRSGIATVKFTGGKSALVESGHGLRTFAAVFGTLEDAIGQVIHYDVDEFGCMSQFSLPEDSE